MTIQPSTTEEAFTVLQEAVQAWWPHRQKDGQRALEIVYAELFGFEWQCPRCGSMNPSTQTGCNCQYEDVTADA